MVLIFLPVAGSHWFSAESVLSFQFLYFALDFSSPGSVCQPCDLTSLKVLLRVVFSLFLFILLSLLLISRSEWWLLNLLHAKPEVSQHFLFLSSNGIPNNIWKTDKIQCWEEVIVNYVLKRLINHVLLNLVGKLGEKIKPKQH